MTKGRLQHTADQYRQQLAAREAQAEQALEAAYQHVLASIQPEINKLLKQMEAMQAAGQDIPLSWLYRQNRLVGIQHVIEQQINHFGTTAHMTTEQLKKDAVTLAQEASQAQMSAVLPSGFSAMFNVPNIRAIETIVGSTQAGSPLADLFNGFGAEASQGAKDALVRGITLGQAPKTVAKGIQDALGVSRSRALVISRTEMMRAYNSATLENYRSNSNVINAWEWLATGARSCFPEGTLIRTKRGLVPIEQVQIGDEVFTHKGRYKRVYDTLQRPYSGEMVTVKSGNNSVIATANHPFLIERQGKLNWIEAGQVRLGDHAICKLDGDLNVGNHSLSQISIERGVRQSDHRVSLPLQEKSFVFVSLGNTGLIMPVHTVNLQNSAQIWQEKINRVSPSFDGVLLQIRDTQRLQTKSCIPFWLSFSSETSVTTHRAEGFYTRLGLARSNAILSPTLFTRLNNSRAAALIRAMFSIGLSEENLTTALACVQNMVADQISFLFSAGIVTIFPSMFARCNCETFSANYAFLDQIGMLYATFSRTILSLPIMRRAKHFAASLADQINRWFGTGTTWSMWLNMLMCNIAFTRAETPFAIALPRFGDNKLFTAHFARQFDALGSICRPPSLTAFRTAICSLLPFSVSNINPSVFSTNGTGHSDFTPISRHSFDTKFFHASIVSQHDIHVQRDTTVYNIEVEEDHSYVANGFVVHNCAMCIDMDGTIHDLDEEFASHPCCRCTPIPVTDSSTSRGLTGSDWFDAQSSDVQQEILSPSKYAAYQDGAITLDDLVGVKQSATWGMSRYEKSLKEVLGADEAQQYY